MWLLPQLLHINSCSFSCLTTGSVSYRDLSLHSCQVGVGLEYSGALSHTGEKKSTGHLVVSHDLDKQLPLDR